MLDNRNPKQFIWMHLETKSKLRRKECQDQSAMCAKDGGIYSESTGQLVTHFQNPPASLKENLIAARLLLDNNDHILTTVKSLATPVA